MKSILPALLGVVATYIVFKLYEIRGLYDGYTIVAICVAIVFLWSSFTGYKHFENRCQKCEEWNAKSIISKDLIDERASHKIKKIYHKDSKGNTISTREVKVPATKYTYHVHDKCNFCGNITDYTQIVTKEN